MALKALKGLKSEEFTFNEVNKLFKNLALVCNTFIDIRYLTDPPEIVGYLYKYALIITLLKVLIKPSSNKAIKKCQTVIFTSHNTISILKKKKKQFIQPVCEEELLYYLPTKITA